MLDVFAFSRQGRSRRVIVVLICVYAVLLWAVIMIDAAWWLMALFALLTIPAVFDIWRNPSAGLKLGQDRLDWHTGKRTGALDFGEIEYMRFDTRWDFSVRVTAMLVGNKRVRLPYEVLPPHRDLETALNARDIRVERHHFTVF